MVTLTVELALPGSEDWTTIGQMREGEREGSMSDNAAEGRQVLRFRVEPDYAVIERSKAGIDYESGIQRGILSTGFELVARLHVGEDYEQMIQTDRMPKPVRIRWRFR